MDEAGEFIVLWIKKIKLRNKILFVSYIEETFNGKIHFRLGEIP